MSDKELIAAARQPTESYREALDKIVTEYDMALYTKEETLDRLSCAAVPDAATEEFESLIYPDYEGLAAAVFERSHEPAFSDDSRGLREARAFAESLVEMYIDQQETLGDPVFRAAAAIAETQARRQNLPPEVIQGVTREHMQDAKAALTAAGVAPQPACLNCNEPVAESDLKANYVGRGYVHQVKCPQEPSRLPDFFAPKPMPNSYVPAQVLPSSGIDEAALGEVIARVTDLWDDPLDEVHDIPQIARAVAEWLKEQGVGKY